jgi:hypothetical protein
MKDSDELLAVVDGKIDSLRVDDHEVQELRWVKVITLNASTQSVKWTHFGYEQSLLLGLANKVISSVF